jgi:hypothetical protein
MDIPIVLTNVTTTHPSPPLVTVTAVLRKPTLTVTVLQIVKTIAPTMKQSPIWIYISVTAVFRMTTLTVTVLQIVLTIAPTMEQSLI